MSFASRTTIATLVLACTASATALAGPTVGATFGKSEAQGDAANGDDANSTVGLYVRGRISRIVSLQGEVSKLDTDATSSSSIRTWNVAAIIDLSHGPLVPFLLVGGGFDVVSSAYGGSDNNYAHAELGGGLEYRFRGGFVLGADLRIGTRSDMDPQEYDTPVAEGGGVAASKNVEHFVASSSLSEGQYRSARVTLGVHF